MTIPVSAVAGPKICHPFPDFYMGKGINRPFHSPIGDTLHSQSHRCARQAAAGATTSSVTTESGKWAASKGSKVSPYHCVRNHEAVTRDPNLIFVSLERALCSLTEVRVGKSLMELQTALQVSIEAFLTTFLYIC
jgi:hypothetical protein